MPLPTNKQAGQPLYAAEVNNIASAVNDLDLSLPANVQKIKDDIGYAGLIARLNALEANPTLTTPAAPTNGIVDDVADTFNFTFGSGASTNIADYEQTGNGGASYVAMPAKPVVIGNVSKAIGQIGVRIKAVAGVSNASATLYNTSAFNIAISNGAYALAATKAEPAPTDFTGWETNPIFIHRDSGDSPYRTGGPMGTGDIIIENRNFYFDNTKQVRWIEAYMPNSTGRKVIIRNCTLVSYSSENMIHVTDNTLIEVRNCRCYCLRPRDQGRRRFFYAYRPKGVTIENNYFENTGGIKIELEPFEAQGLIKIRYNKVLNIHRDGGGDNGSYQQFVQLQHIVERPGTEISWNYVRNLPGQSRVEDNINLGESSGTDASPLLISHNCIDGAYPYDPTVSGFTGTGMTTDAVSSNASLTDLPHNIHATLNTFVRTMNSAMNIAAGYKVLYDYNVIRASGVLSDGTPTFSANNGVSLYRGQPYPAEKFYENSISNNDINYKPRAYYRDPDNYLAEGNTLNTYAITATVADENAAVTAWIQTLEDNQILIGVIN